MYENERICKRCGILWETNQRKSSHPLCLDCRAQPRKTVRYNGEPCIAWHGDFDENDNPMLNGKPFMPGGRSCGHSDCVNGEHWILSEV